MRPAFAVCALMTPSSQAPSLARKAPIGKQLTMVGSGKFQSRHARTSAKPVSKYVPRNAPSAMAKSRRSRIRAFHSCGVVRLRASKWAAMSSRRVSANGQRNGAKQTSRRSMGTMRGSGITDAGCRNGLDLSKTYPDRSKPFRRPYQLVLRGDQRDFRRSGVACSPQQPEHRRGGSGQRVGGGAAAQIVEEEQGGDEIARPVGRRRQQRRADEMPPARVGGD